jgi:hypothetical protein
MYASTGGSGVKRTKTTYTGDLLGNRKLTSKKGQKLSVYKAPSSSLAMYTGMYLDYI